jgi:membrane-associated phospholipid phosphatase
MSDIPNLSIMVGIVVAVLALDTLCRFIPQTPVVNAVMTMLFGVLFLCAASLIGIMSAYAGQRLSMPLQDHAFEMADKWLGIDWLAVTHWVDENPVVARIFGYAYDTMVLQIALPVAVLAFTDRVRDAQIYLLAFIIALAITNVVSTLLPAYSPIAVIDLKTFDLLRFASATPVDHLDLLRSPGSLRFAADTIGGIVSFPSFHASVAVLTPLTLRGRNPLFYGLVILDAAMLCGAVTEGAHYVVDVLAGGTVAVFAHLLAAIMTPTARAGSAGIPALAQLIAIDEPTALEPIGKQWQGALPNAAPRSRPVCHSGPEFLSNAPWLNHRSR